MAHKGQITKVRKEQNVKVGRRESPKALSPPANQVALDSKSESSARVLCADVDPAHMPIKSRPGHLGEIAGRVVFRQFA